MQQAFEELERALAGNDLTGASRILVALDGARNGLDSAGLARLEKLEGAFLTLVNAALSAAPAAGRATQ